MDLSLCTVVPALMDVHVHLFMSGTVDLKRRKEQLSDGFERIQETISRHLEQLIAHGVLAVRDGGDRHGYTRQLQKALLAGEICRHLHSYGGKGMA